MVIGAKAINLDTGHCRAMDLDMALGSRSGLDNTVVPYGSTDHPGWHGLSGIMGLRHQHDHRLWPRPRASMWPLVAPWYMDISTNPGCGRTTDTDMVLGIRQGFTSLWPQMTAWHSD